MGGGGLTLRRFRRHSPRAEARRRAGVDEAGRRLLMYFIVPAWMSAGFADYLCHRRTRIEETSGTHESVVHLLQMSEGGVAALAGLFLEVNAGVLALALGSLAAHQATAAWDVRYAEGRREVTPTEQHVHGMLEQVPVMATAFLVALHWDQARALVGAGPERPRFALRPKPSPLPRGYLGRLLVAIAALVAIPYGEELVRCMRRSPDLAPTPGEMTVPEREALQSR